MIRYAHPDLEGLCRSPHDHPAKLAFMLSMYLDESIEADDGYAVVAGFIGEDVAWNQCMSEWRRIRGSRGPLHMKKLRKWKTDRHTAHLAELATVPQQAGLVLVYMAVRYSDYRDLVDGTFAALGAEGYMLCLFLLVNHIIGRIAQTGLRLEVICEQQLKYAGIREFSFLSAQRYPGGTGRDGMPVLAKWSSIGKSTILEPSDFAAFAILQYLRDPQSRKSVLTQPILKTQKAGYIVPRDEVREQLTMMMKTTGADRTLSVRDKNILRQIFRNDFYRKSSQMTERQDFDTAMEQLLKANPKTVRTAMEEEKKEREAERKAKRESKND